MATKMYTLATTVCLSSATSINTRTSPCISNAITATTSTTKLQSYPYKTRQSGVAPLVPAVRAASGPDSPDPNSSTNTKNSVLPPTLQDDLAYLLKLAAGSILGAALIKYGSAVIPDITRPNITLALLMISSPVVMAALLLFRGSRKE